MDGLGILFAWLLLALVGAAATAWWAQRLWKRRSELSVSTKAVAGIMAASAMFGAFGTVIGLLKAFGAVGGESVDPSQKARLLAEGISEAINCAASGLVVWLPSVAALVLLMRKRRSQSG